VTESGPERRDPRRDPASAPRSTRWPVVWVAFGAGVVASAHVGKLPPALPFIRADLGVDLVTAGWIASLISVTSFMLGIGAGSIADIVGQRRLVLFGLSAFVVGGVAGTVAPDAATLLVARFFESLGFAATTVSGGAIIAQATDHRDRSWAMGVWATYFPLGFGGLLLVSTPVIEQFGWRALWLALAALSVLWATAFYSVTRSWTAPRPRLGDGTEFLRNIERAVRAPGAVLVAACFALYAAQHISFMVWLPTMVRDTWNTGNFLAAAVPALVLICNAGGSYGAAWAMRCGAPLRLLLATGAVGMGLTEIGIFSTVLPPAARLGLALVFGVAGGLIPAAALAATPVYAPSPALIGSLNGLMVTGSNTGQLFGPPALAAVRERAGSWEGVLWPMLALAAASAACALLSRPPEQAPSSGGRKPRRSRDRS